MFSSVNNGGYIRKLYVARWILAVQSNYNVSKNVCFFQSIVNSYMFSY